MRIAFSLFGLLTLGALSAAAQYQSGAAGAPPDTVPPAFAATLDPSGVRIAGPGGKVWCEVWVVKTLATGAKSAEDSVSLPTIPHGSLLGVVRFPSAASDRRGHPVPAGVYALRYSIYPADGNHTGAAPQRDFALLVPIAKDKGPDVKLNYEQLIALVTSAVGAPHPPCLSLFPSKEAATPSLHKEENDWVLHLKIGGQGIAMIVVGKAEG